MSSIRARWPAAAVSGAQVQRLRGVRVAAALPLAALAVYAGVIAARGPELSAARFLDSDAPGAVYQGVSLFSGAVLPVHSEIAPTLAEGWLVGLPSGHLLVALLGPVLGVLAVAMLCLAVRRLGGNWLVAAVATLAAGPIVLASVLFPTAHVFTLMAMAAVSLALVSLDGDRRRVAIVVSAVVAGLALAGDQGFIATGLVPLLAVAAGLWLKDHAWLRVIRVAAIAGIAVAVAVVCVLLLRLAGLSFLGSPLLGAAGVSHVDFGVSLSFAAHSFGWMLGGAWFAPTLGQPLESFLAVAGCAIPLSAPAALALTVRRDGLRRMAHAKLAYLIFWAAADITVLIAFIVFGYAQSTVSGRYLIPCLLSAAATFPFLVANGRRLATSVAVTGFAALQTAGVLLLPATALAGSLAPHDGGAILSAIESRGLTHGYAAYSDSHSLTWLSNEAVHIYPVTATGCRSSTGLCATEYSNAAWYQPAAGSTFLLVRHSSPCVSSGPPAALGAPSQTVRVNADVTLFVYSNDISARIDTASKVLCP